MLCFNVADISGWLGGGLYLPKDDCIPGSPFSSCSRVLVRVLRHAVRGSPTPPGFEGVTGGTQATREGGWSIGFAVQECGVTSPGAVHLVKCLYLVFLVLFGGTVVWLGVGMDLGPLSGC